MFLKKRIILIGLFLISVALPCLSQMGCSTEEVVGGVTAGAIGATVMGGRSPSNEIEQIYYLGMFDPQEQVPPTVYRVRVHGQGSFISRTKFGSGWVKSDLIDSLGTNIKFNDENNQISMSKVDSGQFSSLKPGRRLIQFGPEGFREAPKDHRLVIVMGTSPEDFFNAIDETLGSVSKVIDEQRNSALSKLLFEALLQVKNERERLTDLGHDIELELSEQKEVGL